MSGALAASAVSAVAAGTAPPSQITYTLVAAGLATSTIGYQSGVGGSISPTAWRDGTVSQMFQYSTTSFTVEMTGFSSDPGASYFSNITINGNSLDTSSASYSYSSGTATWSWTSTNTALSIGTTYHPVVTA